ncbi:MAG: DASS family sodium-coupled anion symporter [Sutterellaceae bacterium]|nr:DASS family sodium-coupled anion symporter [Sutterellaceae bacterium]
MSETIAPTKMTDTPTSGFFKRYGLILAFAALALVCMMPEQPGLSVPGQRMLGIMVFAVIVWSTTAVSYPVSGGIIMALMALLVGFAPKADNPEVLFGTAAALKMALGGFSSTAFCLVGAALFLSAAMIRTGLDKRIALTVLNKVGAEPKRIVLGIILCGFILSFFVPSTTARVACLVPIVIGMVRAFGLSMRSTFAGVLMITVAQVDSVWNIGIKTAAAQNMVAVNFIRELTGVDISWLDWFIAAAPLAGIMSVVLYFVVTRFLPCEAKIEGGREVIAKQLADMGPMTKPELKLMIVSLVLLFLWVTEKKLHPLDTSTTTVCAIAVLMMPGVGVMDWKGTVDKINWGTVLLFGVGISLGSALLSTKAAQWLANMIVTNFELSHCTPLFILAVMALFLIIIHLGFASAAGLAAAMIPIIISVLNALQTPDVNVVGLTMILQYVVSFGYILPVNAPQNMIAYSTGAFDVKTFAFVGIILTVVAYALVMLLASTYWSWMGLV